MQNRYCTAESGSRISLQSAGTGTAAASAVTADRQCRGQRLLEADIGAIVGEGDGTASGSSASSRLLSSMRKRRKAEVTLSSFGVFQDELRDGSSSSSSSNSINCEGGSPPPPATMAAQQAASWSAWLPSLPPACGVRIIRNSLAGSHHQQIQFASGSPIVIAASTPSVEATVVSTATRQHQLCCQQQHQQLPCLHQHRPHAVAYISRTGAAPGSFLFGNPVRLDLTSSAAERGVRAELAFAGASEPATAAAKLLQTRFQQPIAKQQLQQQQQRPQQPFVQVRNPLCVPRQSDYLASWRTCMVPIVDLEQFALMKPPCPKWRHLANRSAGSMLLFTLMCYNILSDQYASPKSYWYCPPWALAWSFRRQGILENISAHLPTVVCLQEVETEQYYSFFLPHLTRRGYDGIFSPKSRAKTMDDRLRKRVDGCAIFWKRSDFRLVEEHVIEFSQQYLEHCWAQQQQTNQEESLPSSPGPHRGKASSEIFNRVTVRDNIALAVILAPVAKGGLPDTCVMVCTSHMHWDPQHSDVKLIQTVVLTSALAARIKQFQAATGAATLPLVLCGDFNSLPDSGVIEFLNRGSVERDHPEFRRLGCDPSLDGLKLPACSTDSPSKAPSSSSSFSHSLDLASCYNAVDMTYTNYTHDFKGVIDYIFASRRHFRVLDCLEGVTDWLRSGSVIGCPHPYVPSDHIPLAVQLELLPVSCP